MNRQGLQLPLVQHELLLEKTVLILPQNVLLIHLCVQLGVPLVLAQKACEVLGHLCHDALDVGCLVHVAVHGEQVWQLGLVLLQQLGPPYR